MLGAFSIGSRFIGAGRSLDSPYIEASATALGAGLVITGPGRVFIPASATATGAGIASSAAPQVVSTASATAQGAGSCSAAPSARLRAAAAAQGEGIASADALRRAFGSTFAIGAGLASGDHRVRRPGSASAVGAGLAGADGARHAFASASAIGAGSAAGASNAARTGSATAIGSGSMSGEATLKAPGARVEIRIPPRDNQSNIDPKVNTITYRGDDLEIQVDEFTKQPAEVVDYLLNMTEWFRRIKTDSIDSIAVTILPTGTAGDLEAGPGNLPDWQPIGTPVHQARIWIGGGRDGIEYQVTARVTTNEGRIEEVDFLIIVEER